MISKNNVFAFDECSILHLCAIRIPAAFKIYFDKEKLVHANFSKLSQFKTKLYSQNINKYRFHPLNLETNIIKTADKLLLNEGNQVLLLPTLKSQIIEQLSDFIESEIHEFKIIHKNKEITEIKKIFIDNEKNLTKEKNIPEDDDLMIISGFMKFDSTGDKHLISEDEHFWGYKDLIKDKFNVNIIEEWECHKL